MNAFTGLISFLTLLQYCFQSSTTKGKALEAERWKPEFKYYLIVRDAKQLHVRILTLQ
jgi:hypothetical protein